VSGTGHKAYLKHILTMSVVGSSQAQKIVPTIAQCKVDMIRSDMIRDHYLREKYVGLKSLEWRGRVVNRISM